MNEKLEILLIKQDNKKYSNNAIEILKPFKPKLDLKLDGVDQILFQTMTLQMIENGITKDDVKLFEDSLTRIMGCKIQIRLQEIQSNEEGIQSYTGVEQ